MLKRLDAISEDNGVPYGRVHELFEAEKKYGLQVTGGRFTEVEKASFRRFQCQHLNNVQPAQLCPQPRHNPEIGELLRKLGCCEESRAARLAAEP